MRDASRFFGRRRAGQKSPTAKERSGAVFSFSGFGDAQHFTFFAPKLNRAKSRRRARRKARPPVRLPDNASAAYPGGLITKTSQKPTRRLRLAGRIKESHGWAVLSQSGPSALL